MEKSRKALVEQPPREVLEEDVVDNMDVTSIHQSDSECIDEHGEVNSIELVDICSDEEDKELLVFMVREETDSDSSVQGTCDERPVAISLHLMSPLTRKKQQNTTPKTAGNILPEAKHEKEAKGRDSSYTNIDHKGDQTDFEEENALYIDHQEDEVQVKTEKESDETEDGTALEVDYQDDQIQVKTEKDIDEPDFEAETAVDIDYQECVEEVKKVKKNRKQYPCDICGKEFTAPCHLKIHQRMHTGERPFACTLCKKAFKRKSHLEDHQRTHGNEKKYICGICKGSFPHPSSLSRHLRLHSSHHLCHLCGKSFEFRTGLVNHIALECGEKAKIKPDVKKVPQKSKVEQDPQNGVGQVTNSKTRNKRNPGGGRRSYKWHLDSASEVYSGEKRFLCGVCNKVYSDEAMYRIHELMHKDISAYSCDVCKKSFSDVSILEIHMRTHNM